MRANFACEDLPKSDKLIPSLTVRHRIPEWPTRSKKSVTPFKAKVPSQVAQPSFAVSAGATCGPAAKEIATLPFADSATRTSWGRMAPGGGQFGTAFELADAVACRWPGDRQDTTRPYVVFTGGEPLLQLDQDAVNALHERGFEVAIETNGTIVPPRGIDWLCCSPKAGTELVIHSGDELKLVFPQQAMNPAEVERLDFRYFYLQPMDGPDQARNVKLTLNYCLENPRWRISLQTHKLLGIP